MKWIVIILLIAGGAFYAYQKRESWGTAAGPAESARPTTAQAETRDIRFTVNAAGEISPAEQVSVKPEINGRIETLPVDIGDIVKKDQVLFTLDDKELQNQRSSIQTEVERAKLQLEQAERNYKRAEQLFQDNLISQELYENSKTEFALGRNALDRSLKDLAIIEERLTKTKIVAPFDCTVLTRPISMGQAVSGSGGFNSGTEVLTIADLHHMIINAHVNQADITRLKVNQEVEISVEAVAGLVVTGRVERIAPQATIRNNIKGFAVRILLENVDQRVRPGMTANIKIPVAAADNVLAVPLAAVFTERDPETGRSQRFVYIVHGDGELEKRAVTIGVADLFYAEIQEGLDPGEVVALELPKSQLSKVAQQWRDEQRGPGGTGSRPPASGTGARPAPAGGKGDSGTPRPASPSTPRPTGNRNS